MASRELRPGRGSIVSVHGLRAVASNAAEAAVRAAVSLGRATRLFRVANWAIARSPAGVQSWVETQRLRTRIRMGEERLVPEDELQASYEDALDLLVERHGERELGDYLEFGVYVGSSLLCMHRALASRELMGVRLIGFDSFEGLPANASDEDEGAWRAGDYSSDLETTRKRLASEGVDWSRVHLVPGWFDQTLTQKTRVALGLERASVIMIDCDVYSSAKVALEFCAPLIDDSVIFLDDWHSENLAARGLGEKRAFDEFCAAHPDLSVHELTSYSPNAAVFHVTRMMSGSEPAR